jgi:mRNA-degrading endonuclease toxin of MazEF toxin-antitoxin module
VGRHQFGQIVLAYIDDGNRRTKERPVVIISSDDECDRGVPLQVVAISKSIEDPCPPYHFVVHSSHALSPYTGLNAPCVAKCNWVREIDQSRVIRLLGYANDELSEKILQAVNDLFDDDDFDGWQ